MKRILLLISMITSAVVLVNCSSSKKSASASTSKVAAVTYNGNVKALIETKCTPCHIPAKGGFKKALDSYASVSANIDEIIRRIQMNPVERGFMPFKHEKLSETEIQVFKDFKAGGSKE